MKEDNIENVPEHKSLGSLPIFLLAGVVLLIIFNQFQIMSMSSMVGVGGFSLTGSVTKNLGKEDLSNVDLNSIKGTGYAIAALFPVEDIKTAQDALNMIIPTGTPDYGQKLGISYDDPVTGLSKLVNVYQTTQLSGDLQQRYVNLVTKPVGISCEYCCGVGPIGADNQGRSICGCQHNPALLGLTKWLIKNTDYSDAKIVKEALKWKALFFPKNMVELTTSLAGGDLSALNQLPGMVGGC